MNRIPIVMAFSLSEDPKPSHKDRLKRNRHQEAYSLVEVENRVWETATKKREGECWKGKNQRREDLNSMEKLFKSLISPQIKYGTDSNQPC